MALGKDSASFVCLDALKQNNKNITFNTIQCGILNELVLALCSLSMVDY